MTEFEEFQVGDIVLLKFRKEKAVVIEVHPYWPNIPNIRVKNLKTNKVSVNHPHNLEYLAGANQQEEAKKLLGIK